MRRENIMTSGGYYVATHILTVWKRLAGLEPDQPHGWSFPDARRLLSSNYCDEQVMNWENVESFNSENCSTSWK